jgi:abortive infection bacteriophage resistance protein
MLKQATAYAQQIQILRDHGCTVSDDSLCETILSRIGYYRLSAYFLPFKAANGKYKAGTDFNKVYSLYEFDRKLRNLILSATEEIEVYLRSQLSYYHAQKYGADGYLDAGNYNGNHRHAEFLQHVNAEIGKNKKLPFVRHHILNYNSRFPIWVIVELFTFGMLSYFYADLIRTDQKQIAHVTYNTTDKILFSWLRCCTVLRNMCAHSARLYYSIFSSIPAGIPQLSPNSSRRLFGVAMALRALYPVPSKWNTELLPSFAALFEQYADVIDLTHIGFPDDWEVVMQK